MLGYNGFADLSASHCTAAACTSARVCLNADTAVIAAVSIFIPRITAVRGK